MKRSTYDKVMDEVRKVYGDEYAKDVEGLYADEIRDGKYSEVINQVWADTDFPDTVGEMDEYADFLKEEEEDGYDYRNSGWKNKRPDKKYHGKFVNKYDEGGTDVPSGEEPAVEEAVVEETVAPVPDKDAESLDKLGKRIDSNDVWKQGGYRKEYGTKKDPFKTPWGRNKNEE